ncbi:MAG: Heme O synthase, protoheme IX farnesyltransferase COX10-CtaB, partial [uncultured Solirubrobacteraceae bacterium]
VVRLQQHRARTPAPGGARLRRAHQAEGAVAAAADHGHHDVHRGRPVGEPRADRADRRLPVGGRRRRGQPLVRPRHRPADAAHGRPARAQRPGRPRLGADLRARPRRDVDRGPVDRGQPAGRRAVVLGLPGLHGRLHGVAQAPHAAEHRHRRRRRRGPAARGVGGDDGLAERHGAVPLRDRLLLDAAALLGAVAAHEGRVRARGRPDAARRARRGRDAPADPPLQRPALRRDPAALLRRRLRVDLPHRVVGPQRAVHRRRGAALPPEGPPQRAAPVPVLPRLPRPAVRVDGRRRTPL